MPKTAVLDGRKHHKGDGIVGKIWFEIRRLSTKIGRWWMCVNTLAEYAATNKVPANYPVALHNTSDFCRS
jgi:hypothetical protein